MSEITVPLDGVLSSLCEQVAWIKRQLDAVEERVEQTVKGLDDLRAYLAEACSGFSGRIAVVESRMRDTGFPPGSPPLEFPPEVAHAE